MAALSRVVAYAILSVTVLCLCSTAAGESQLLIGPQRVTTQTDQVTFTCKVTDVDVTGIEIRKKGRIVKYTPDRPLEFGQGKDGRFNAQAYGGFDGNVHTLMVTMSRPGLGDEGEYTCVVTGEKLVEKVTQNLSVEQVADPAIESPEVSSKSGHVLLQEVVKLHQELQARVDNLTDNKVKNQAAFSAQLTSQMILITNDTVIFPKVTINEGGHYNNTSGQYTAPVDGLYSFHLSLRVNCQPCYLYTKLCVNDHTTYSLFTEGHSSIRPLLDLHAGDKVWVKVFSVNSYVTMAPYGYSFFNGYILSSK